MKYKAMKEVTLLLLLMVLLNPAMEGQRRNKTVDTLQHAGFPYADFVNGGGFGKGILLGLDYFHDPGLAGDLDGNMITIKNGLSKHSYVGLGTFSPNDIFDPAQIYLDFEFYLFQKNLLTITGYVSGMVNSDFDNFLLIPGLKARLGDDFANVTVAYNPIIDLGEGDIIYWSPFFLNRNAGLQLNGFYHLRNSSFSFFLNNSLVLENVFDMWVSNIGLSIDFNSVRLSPFIRNSYIKFFDSTWNSMVGISISLKL
jgi:hypothetical protein